MKNSQDITRMTIADGVKTHGDERDAMIPIMQYVQDRLGVIDQNAMDGIAEALGISSADVWGTASFYSFFQTKPHGKYVIRLCKTISCDMKDKDAIVSAIETKLGIAVGETSSDRRFTFLETNCLGQCHQGPAMLVNNEIHTDLTAEKAIQIIEELS